MSVTRERISEKLNRRRLHKDAFDIKLAPGGIRDIEFLVQCLQRLHGGQVPWVRHGGTMLALARLSDKDLLSAAEYARLVSAYRFLRNLEHRLQFAEDRQTHTMPTAARELDILARKMPVAQLGSAPSGEKLLHELNAHLEAVQEIYERVIHSQRPSYYNLAPASPAEVQEAPPLLEPVSSNLLRFLDQCAPVLAQVVARTELRRGAGAFEHFLEKAVKNPDWLSLLNTDGPAPRHTLDIFEHSPYFAEELIRLPELIEELGQLPAGSANTYAESASQFDDITALRRFFRREMFRIQAASICLRAPVFQTLEITSDLADAAIAACYRMALEQVLGSHPPATAGYEARQQLMVVALGRLGMREFDLASDADLVFVLPDADQHEHLFWTRVAERLIDLVTAYTGAGLMFAVDTRLRPNGSAGALVQTEASQLDYFAKNAAAWEGLAYMKARAVAGDLDSRHEVPQRAATGGLAALRPERAFQERPAADAHAAGERAGPRASAEGRPGRFLRHRFLAAVSAAEERRDFLQSAEHARAHRHHRSHGPPGSRGLGVSARRRHVLSRRRSRLARVFGAHRR